MADLFGTPALAGMHLVLEDVDPAPLPKMEALAHKLNDAMDAKATIATTTDLHAGLDGADFVIVCISTGGLPLHGGGPRRAGGARHHPDRRRQRRPGRHQPVPAQRARPGRDRQGDGGALSRCVALQHHQSHDLPDPRRVSRKPPSRPSGCATRWATSAWTWPSRSDAPSRRRVGVGDGRQPLPCGDVPRRRRGQTVWTCSASSPRRSGAWRRLPRIRGDRRPMPFPSSTSRSVICSSSRCSTAGEPSRRQVTATSPSSCPSPSPPSRTGAPRTTSR